MLQGARILIKRTRARGRFNAALGRPASDNRKLPVSDNRELHTRRTRRSRRTCRGAPLQLVFGVLADLGESEGASAPRAAGPAKALCSPSNPGGRRRQFPAGAVPSRYGAHRPPTPSLATVSMATTILVNDVLLFAVPRPGGWRAADLIRDPPPIRCASELNPGLLTVLRR